jgi:hypothetical protein
MACMTLLAPPLAMATTQLARRTCFEIPAPWSPELNTLRHSLRMNWVVVTGKSGCPELRAQWMTDETC